MTHEYKDRPKLMPDISKLQTVASCCLAIGLLLGWRSTATPELLKVLAELRKDLPFKRPLCGNALKGFIVKTALKRRFYFDEPSGGTMSISLAYKGLRYA